MSTHTPKPTVLVLDDSKGNRLFAAVLLKPEGYAVLQAGNITAALEILASEPVDLVLADVRIPGGGGFELYERLRGGPHATIPFLLMTAALDSAIQERASRVPGLHLVERPVDADDYVAAVKAAMPAKN